MRLETRRGVIFVSRLPPDKSYQVKRRVMKVKQMEEAVQSEGNKGSALFVVFYSAAENNATVTSKWHSWIVTHVTFKPSGGSFERQMQNN